MKEKNDRVQLKFSDGEIWFGRVVYVDFTGSWVDIQWDHLDHLVCHTHTDPIEIELPCEIPL